MQLPINQTDQDINVQEMIVKYIYFAKDFAETNAQ